MRGPPKQDQGNASFLSPPLNIRPYIIQITLDICTLPLKLVFRVDVFSMLAHQSSAYVGPKIHVLLTLNQSSDLVSATAAYTTGDTGNGTEFDAQDVLNFMHNAELSPEMLFCTIS